MRLFINAQGGLQHAMTGLFKGPDKKCKLIFKYKLRAYHGNATFSKSVLYLPVREYSSTRLQGSFALEEPTPLGKWKVAKEENTNMPRS